MKLIEAILQPTKFEAVREALTKIGIKGMTVFDVQGFGRQRGHTEIYRGQEYTVNLVRKILIQVAVEDPMVNDVVETILKTARSGAEGRIGDGKIFVLSMDEAIRIRTGEKGADAL